MVTADWMEQEVLKVVPDAIVEVSDLHGSGDHFHVRVISQSYDGVMPLQRQKPILNHFKKHIEENTVHALDLKCMTPKQAEDSTNTAFDPHGQEQEFYGVHIRRQVRD
ncbi:MAG: hypothetical protein CMB61_06955 [Euryarchaeota archaeon]|nr:hypothetical protein [Euryarchaeota archaeon]MBJ29773.1 hypothetical protein [Euryarchaeota archaeon]|tara:strand:+ start:795 stop:1118 length:324 start_codon:yes stop_codon:yes gene_type:complete